MPSYVKTFNLPAWAMYHPEKGHIVAVIRAEKKSHAIMAINKLPNWAREGLRANDENVRMEDSYA